MSEIRYDFFDGEYSIISPERLTRLGIFIDEKFCPFCPGREIHTPDEIYSLKDKNGWKVRVVPNLYKALKIEETLEFYSDNILEKITGFGAHEIVIDTPRHLLKMDEWSKEEFYNWLYVIKERVKDLVNDKRLKYFSIFKNHGKRAGATLSHPHTQIIVLPTVPKNKIDYFNKTLNFFKENSENIFDFLIKKETNILIETKNFYVFAPLASKEAFEVKILSKESSSIIDINIYELSDILKYIFFALYKVLGDFDFNIIFSNPILNEVFYLKEFFERKDEIFRFSLTIIPRLFEFGGFELESGMRINVVEPKKVYKELKRYL